MDEDNKVLDDHTDDQDDNTIDDSSIVEETAELLGIDPDTEDESLQNILRNAVEREKKHKKELDVTIRQKQTQRSEKEELQKRLDQLGNTPNNNQGNEKLSREDIETLASEKAKQLLEERDLQELQLPEELEKEVREYAKFKNISVREASETSYIKNQKQEFEKQQRLINATPNRGKESGASGSKVDITKPLNYKDFLKPDGNPDVEAWNEAKARRQKYVESQM